jgi:hypothetical protein
VTDDQRPTASPPREADELGAAPTIAAGGRGGRASGEPRPRTGGGRRRLGIVPLVILLVIALALAPTLLGSLKKTPRNRVGISYGGGPIEGSHFQRIVQPGSGLFFNGLFDQLYLYPSDQQNYIVSKTASQGSTKGSDSITAPTSDRVQVQYQVSAFFKLNIDRLRAFHEQLGLKYKAYTSDGWNAMLQDTLRQQIESAIQQETRQYTVSELFGNAKVLTTIQTEVRTTIAEQLVQSLGQEYFCGPNYVPGGGCDPITFFIKKIDIPLTVSQSFEAIQSRRNQATAIDALSDALRRAGPEYAKILAVESGKTTFWIIPDGTDVVVPAPGSMTPTTPTTAPSSSSSSSSSSTTTTTTTP